MDIFEKAGKAFIAVSITTVTTVLIGVTVAMFSIAQFLPGCVMLALTLLVGGLWCWYLPDILGDF